MAISASLVKELREKSGAGMMDCKKALVECDGDLEQASEFLRKKGLAKAAKKSGRTAAEGVVAVKVEGHKACIMEMNCETDFVTKNPTFLDITTKVLDHGLSSSATDLESFTESALPGTDKTVKEQIVEGVMTTGENLQLRKMHWVECDGVIAHYVHNALPGNPNMGKIAVVVALSSSSKDAAISEFGKHVAMHIAAAKPKSLDVESLDQAVVEKESAFLREQALNSGKPEAVVEKMIGGRIRKFYEEIVLLEQVSMLDGKAKIKDLLAELSSKVGSEVKIDSYIRLELGEGIEKVEENLADEVKKMTSGA